jgi:hypothetical protein
MQKQILFLLLVSSSMYAKPQAAQKKVQQEQDQKLQQKKKTASSPKKPNSKTASAKVPDQAYIIDRVEAVIFGSEVTDIVTLSDIQRIGFDGKYHAKEEVIADRVMFQDALKYRIAMDEKAVDEYMVKVSKNLGGTLDDIKAMFTQSGYTYEEGRRQFAMMYANNQLIDHKIRSRLIVPERVVIEYYEANPIITQASYLLERGFVPATSQNSDEVRKKIDTFTATGRGLMVTWYQLPEVSQEDIAEDKKFILGLKEGQISAPIEIKGGFELFRLKTKKPAHVVPLEERYREIIDLLRRPKFEEMLAEYKKELLNSASILYL